MRALRQVSAGSILGTALLPSPASLGKGRPELLTLDNRFSRRFSRVRLLKTSRASHWPLDLWRSGTYYHS